MLEKLLYINTFFNLLAIGIWIGSITFFSFGVAGTIFKNLPSKNDAGKLNGIILKKLNKIEHICIKLFLLTFLISFFMENNKAEIDFIRLFIFAIMSGLTFIYSMHITKKTDMLKEKILDFDEVKDTPDRKEFDKYHKLYVKMMASNLLLGLALLFCSTLSLKIS